MRAWQSEDVHQVIKSNEDVASDKEQQSNREERMRLDVEKTEDDAGN